MQEKLFMFFRILRFSFLNLKMNNLDMKMTWSQNDLVTKF